MDNRSEVREFLTSRRAKITPQQAGLPAHTGNRRVKGLRREEVALLAGVSAEYYARLERGNLSGVSEPVLDSLARALQLDDAERAHLDDLARTANTTRRPPRRRAPQPIRPALQHLLDAMTDAPAFIRNGRLDIVATNRLGRALYAPVFAFPARPVNLARYEFLAPGAADFLPQLEMQAAGAVALLRTEAGRDPYNRDLTDLIGELSTRSEKFRTLWAAHDVRLHQTGVKHFRHPEVGELSLPFEAMPLPTDPGLTLTALSAEPGTPGQDALRLLASWAVTLDQAEATTTDNEHRA
ncbi:Helix-turn-helix domain-containing protein [Streptomyces sp. 3213]|uniref:helix-turn-helix transcriptional regulator n=1 Tax=Streptomyces sp. 3213.3 TaxID=1855348 RepID=UPI00089CA943|nr:helix-turn-helix transcriptional regulator [Streptomyces sp. 3213.3]SEC67888.1 Helix-turn-helix domain-containing protein [Streptomyces sp. 3213] [Streptomyces sp. 3213.3]